MQNLDANIVPKVLIIDDSIIARNIIGNIAKSIDFVVSFASCAEEAIKILDEKTFDCITLDLLMPQMSGMDFMRLIKTKGINSKIIVLSADIQETTKKECFDLGAKFFLNKPPKPQELISALKESILDSEVS